MANKRCNLLDVMSGNSDALASGSGETFAGDGVVFTRPLAYVVEQGRKVQSVEALALCDDSMVVILLYDPGYLTNRDDLVTIDRVAMVGIVLRTSANPSPLGQELGPSAHAVHQLQSCRGSVARAAARNAVRVPSLHLVTGLPPKHEVNHSRVAGASGRPVAALTVRSLRA